MLASGSGARIQSYKRMPDKSYDDNPASGVKTEVLPTSKNVKILSIATRITWTVQPTPLEVHGIIDGIPFLWSVPNPASATWYYAKFVASDSEIGQLLTPTEVTAAVDQHITARSAKIEVEATGGTFSRVQCVVKYEQIP